MNAINAIKPDQNLHKIHKIHANGFKPTHNSYILKDTPRQQCS